MKIIQVKKLTFLFLLLTLSFLPQFSTAAPIVKNDTEDLDIIIQQIIGTEPNVVTILDLSGSMGRNFGGEQVGDWDGRDVFDQCGGANWRRAFCAENIANLTVCSSRTCTTDGHRCESPEDLLAQRDCVKVETSLSEAAMDTELSIIYDRICGNDNGVFTETIDDCNTSDERNRAAAAMEAVAGLTQCSIADNCQQGSDDDPSCNFNSDFTRFRDCMEDNNLQSVFDFLRPANCTGGTEDCRGDLERGSSRMDVALNVLFNVLDADDSLSELQCSDSNQQYDGTSSTISCEEYMETPYRGVGSLVENNNNSLPGTGSTRLSDELTVNDAEILGVRFRPMSYAGNGVGDDCDASNSFRFGNEGDNGFTTDYESVWDFYNHREASGGTPLAKIIGFDDTLGVGGSIPNEGVENDAIRAFAAEMGADASVQCRPQFIIVITDGDDSCSGDCNDTDDDPGCDGVAANSNNSNRRSAIQAVSNIRTYFARNPTTRQVDTDGDGTTETITIRKEVIVFVIGLGIQDPIARRALQGMAMAGGTHTTGVIKHIDPATGIEVGSVIVDPEHEDSVLPGTAGDDFEVFRALSRAKDIDTDPSAAHLQTCSTPDINGHCHFQNVDIFGNDFLDQGLPFTDFDGDGDADPPQDGPDPDEDPDNVVEGFAFLVNTPDELIEALNDILFSIEGVSTSGISPAAPQSSTAVALRDRIFLSILTPLTGDRLWQGRMAAFGFIDDPNNPGGKVVIRKPPSADPITNVDALSIFDDDGTLNPNAKKYHWEVGKNLAERDIDTNIRTLYTVRAPDLSLYDEGPPIVNPFDPDETTTPDFDTDLSGGVIRYLGPLVPLHSSVDPPFTMAGGIVPPGPGQFGITEDDVTDPIPEYCVPEGAAVDICESSEHSSIDCSDTTTADCIACVTTCIKDEVVGFLKGNTEIATVPDPMGQPELGAFEEDSMGFGCPDPDDENEDMDTGSFANCSVRMGDIFHSSPVIVGSPSPLFFDQGFQQFAFEFRDRSAVLYVGANDGFLHAFHAGELIDPNAVGADNKNPFTNEEEVFPFFNEGTGFEMFGLAVPTYLPDSLNEPPTEAESPADIVFGTPPPPDFRTGDFKNFVLDNSTQRSFSDGSPVIGDIFIDGFVNGIDEDPELCPGTITDPDGLIDPCGREWHTVLITGSRNGGGAYMAIDITNPACGENCGQPGEGGDDVSLHISQSNGGLPFPMHLWTLFDPDFGNTWSTPTFGRTRLKFTVEGETSTVDRWVMFVGGGADPTVVNPSSGVNFGNVFAVVDIATGKEIFKFHPDNPVPSGTDEPDNIDQMVCDVPGQVGAFDLNADGYIDIVYFGDSCGRLWRFDVSEPIEVTDSISDTGRDGDAEIIADSWTGEIIFCANTDSECFNGDDNKVPTQNLEPIFFSPSVTLDDLGRRHVIFVTGDRRDPSSIDKFGRLYNIIDGYIPSFLAGGTPVGSGDVRTTDDLVADDQVIELEEQSGLNGQFVTSTGNSFTADQGEFVVIFPNNVIDSQDQSDTEEGEKGFGSPVVINRVLIFTTFAPEADGISACTAGVGEGRVFALDFITGEGALIRIPGAKDSGIFRGSESQNQLAAGVTAAEGMPTPAQLTFGARGSVLMSVAFTGGPTAGGSQFLVWELPPFPTKTQTLFWEELL